MNSSSGATAPRAAQSSVASGDGPSMHTQVGHLSKGSRVSLTGLVMKPELNGAIGIINGDIDPESGRAPIRIISPSEHAGKGLRVKTSNLVPALP